MNPEELASYLSGKGFSVKRVPLLNTRGFLGKEGVNTFDLTSNYCDRYIGSKFWTCIKCAKMFDSQTSLKNHIKTEHFGMMSVPRQLLNLDQPGGIVNVVDTVPSSHVKPERDETSYIIIKPESEDQDEQKKKRYRRPETKPRKPYEKKHITNTIKISSPFKCNACNEIFPGCCSFSMHMSNVHLKRRRLVLRCQICERKYNNRLNESEEIPYLNPNSDIVCNLCGKIFALQAHLDYHEKKYHTKTKQYECTLCSKSFTQVAGLSQHMKIHTGVKPYMCNVCLKTFRQKAGLDQHMRIHNKIKPYSCLICDRAFTQSAHLNQHMRVHTKIEPYECNLCGRKFKQTSHLNFHMRSHEA